MTYLKVFTDFAEVISPLGDAEAGRLFKAMLGYAATGAEPDFHGNERFVWPAAKQSIDRTAAFNEKQRENGSLGGRPKNPKKPNETQNNPTKPNITLKDKDKDKDKENNTPPTPSKGAGAIVSKRFVPPTLEEITAYCIERELHVDPKQFYDYFTEGKWIDSEGKPVLNWKQKMLTWEKMNGGRSNGSGTAARPKGIGRGASPAEIASYDFSNW